MQITVTTLSDQLFTLDVGEDLELENFKALCAVETGFPPKEMSIVWNGRPLRDDKQTLKQYGIQNGEMLLIQQMRSSRSPQQQQASGQPPAASSSGVPRFDFGSIRIPGQSQPRQPSQPPPNREEDPAIIRDMLLSNPSQLAILKERNPPLADALGDLEKFRQVFEEQKAARVREEQERIRLLTSDPFDSSAQEKIAETIRQKNIDTNMQTAMEYSPESFGQVHMLYIDCKVNGHPVKAFVDSGAQMTIMSQQCADRCNIMRLVDKRWAGVAKGVGTQRILGRVHLCQIQIGSAYLQTSFSILEDQPMDMLLGLDMLKRHECVIDLKKNQLEISSAGIVAPFLAEADLPAHARLNNPIVDSDQSGAGASSTPSSSGAQQFSEDLISRLMSNGFNRPQVLEALRSSNGDADQALALLFSNMP